MVSLSARFIQCTFCFLQLASLQCYANEATENTQPKADLWQSKLNTMMQNTASWLDNIAHDNSKISTEKDSLASATGYLQLSWLPSNANLADTDAKFKVYFNLPEWNEKLSLVIDNDNEEELLLDYESDNTPNEQSGVNIALQYLKLFNNKWQIKNRLGMSQQQLYLRSEMQFNWHIKRTHFKLQPRLDYLLQDGWGPSIKGVLNYSLGKSNISISASWQKIQSEARSRRKVGLFHIISPARDEMLVSGIQYTRNNNEFNLTNDTYVISSRYRNLLYNSWMYVELEPFIKLNQQHDYKREIGIAMSLISYYGH